MIDKITETLVDGLKQAMATPGEQRLFRSGKLSGLFPGRTGVSAEAAARALREGLVQVVRTETKGKITTEWVQPSPRGVHFVYEHESPQRALEELRAVLQTNRDAVPVWLAEIRHELQALAARLTEQAERWTHQFDALSQRVEETLRRAEAGKTAGTNGAPRTDPWAVAALAYLDRRSDGATGPCPLPELFAALREQYTELSMTAFHDGLRRLRDRQALRLHPFTGQPGELPQPEYAVLDGAVVLYYASR